MARESRIKSLMDQTGMDRMQAANVIALRDHRESALRRDRNAERGFALCRGVFFD